MKRVSIRQAIIDAIEETDAGLARYENQALKWAKYIEKAIGSKNGYKVKAKTFNVTGCYLDLPEDCYSVIGLFPGDHEDQCNLQYRNYLDPLIKEDVRAGADVYDRDLTMYWIPVETTWLSKLYYEEIANQLHVISDYDNQDMTLVYSYNETDMKGDWIVNESHIEAISAYVQYMYAKKFRWKLFKGDKLLRSGHKQMLMDLEKEYSVAVRSARAEDGKETEFEQSQF
jgi:hypothetical protein